MVRVGVPDEQGLPVRAELVYFEPNDAHEAGETLRRVHEVLSDASNPVIRNPFLRSVGRSAHATLRGEVVEVVLVVPLDRGVSGVE